MLNQVCILNMAAVVATPLQFGSRHLFLPEPYCRPRDVLGNNTLNAQDRKLQVFTWCRSHSQDHDAMINCAAFGRDTCEEYVVHPQ